jgi:hypothetical protein
VALAEVPGHNPDLDNKCSEGFQWSRLTVACEQANCPPGARRNYTLECSCGEVWGEPYKTCMSEVGLAAYCIGADKQCENVKGGFDPLTGECKFMEGYEWNADRTKCERLFPEKMKCKVQDPQGNPITGTEVIFGEYTNNPLSPDSNQNITTDDQGQVEVSLQNQRVSSVKFIVRQNNGFYRANKEIKADQAYQDCVVTVYTNEMLEKWIKDQYKDFLKDACLPADLIKKIDDIEFEFDADVSNSQYDPETKKMQISSGDTSSDWDTLSKALMHEFAHYISDSIIDPSSWYIKGYPLFGKYAGGSHDNWTPHKKTDEWGPDVDPEQLAFEEGLADFIAAMYYQSQGQVYQSDLQDPQRAMAEIAKNPGQAVVIEGAITNFLMEYYKNQAASGKKGAAQAVGDFIRATTYESRHALTWLGVPARTIKEFIASKAKSLKKDPANACTFADMPDLSALVAKYGINGSSQGKIKFEPKDGQQHDQIKQTIGGMDFSNADSYTINNLIPMPNVQYEFPAGTGPIFQIIPDNYATDGEAPRVGFSPEVTNIFSVDPSNMISMQQGRAHVTDTIVQTDNLIFEDDGTDYLIEVKDGQETFKVLTGRVLVTNKNDSTQVLTLAENQAAIYTLEKGLIQDDKIGQDLEAAMAGKQDDHDNKGRNMISIIGLIFIIGLGAAAFYIIKMRKKQ